VTSDGAGGFDLVGNATQAQYEAVLNTLQYINTLASPTLTNRIITITVNDGASDSNTLTSTLYPPTDGDFTNSIGAPVSTYYEGDTIYFSVNDQTGNLDSGTADTITITVTSTSGDSEEVELTETGPNTGIFTGSIASTTDAADVDNGVLTAIIGNTLTATHVSVAGCGVWTDTVQIIEPTFERKELYFTPSLLMDRIDPVATNDLTTSTYAMLPPDGGDDMTGTWVYNANSTNNASTLNAWDGETFGATTTVTTPARTGRWTNMAGAAAPTRNERIVIGTDSGNTVEAMIWNGTSWTLLTRGTLGIGGTAGSVDIGLSVLSGFRAADVAYEQVSGRAMMVWSDSGTLRYSLYNGTSWTSGTITGLASNVRHVQLASDPNSNRLALVVNTDNELDLAYIWNGTAWVDEQFVDANTAHDRTDINVAFESVSGDVLVVYATGTSGAVGYHTYTSGGWTSSGTINPPAGTDGYARWTDIAADPNSNRIVLGVLSNGTGANNTADAWTAIWNGSSWGSSTLAAANVSGPTANQSTAVAFESVSGDAMVAYPSGTASVAYRTWDGTAWSAAATLPVAFVNNSARFITLDSNPYSDQIMVTVLDGGSDINIALWNGSGWSDVDKSVAGIQSNYELTDNATAATGQNFVYIWDVYQHHDPPSPFYLTTVRTAEGGADAGIELGSGNLGGGSEMRIRSDDRRGLIAFDLSPFVSDGEIVQQAGLTVFINSSGGAVNVYPVTQPWTEAAVTWANQPTHNATNLLGTIPAGTSGYYTITSANLTALAQDWLDFVNSGGSTGSPNYGVIFVHSGGAGGETRMRTKEQGYAVSPALSVRTRDGAAVSATFTQSPAFAAPFEIYSGSPVTVTSYIQVTSGSFVNPPDIDAVLRSGTTNLLVMAGDPTVTVVNAPQQIYRLEWSGSLASDQTIPAGTALSVRLTTNESFEFDILYDSKFYPSRVSLPTNTVITLDALGVYSAAYPGGVPITNINTVGTPVYIRAEVSDPFGHYDITSLDVEIKNSAGVTVHTVTLNNSNAVVLDDATKLYRSMPGPRR
jgi:hypothetical protein